MTETGRILEINGGTVKVAPDKSSACFGCMNQECRSSGGVIMADNPLSLYLEMGQTVKLEVSGISVLREAAAAVLPPLLGFIGGYTAAGFVFPNSGGSAKAGTGLFFLFTAAFIVFTARKKHPAKNKFTVAKVISRPAQ